MLYSLINVTLKEKIIEFHSPSQPRSKIRHLSKKNFKLLQKLKFMITYLISLVVAGRIDSFEDSS